MCISNGLSSPTWKFLRNFQWSVLVCNCPCRTTPLLIHETLWPIKKTHLKKTILLLVPFLFIIDFSFSQVLELNLTVGESYYHDNKTKVLMTQEINGESLISDISYGGKMSFLVKEKTDSAYHLEVRFQTMYMKVNANGNEISANSQKVDSTDILSMLLQELTESPFDISITKYGIVQEVTMEKVFDNLFSSVNTNSFSIVTPDTVSSLILFFQLSPSLTDVLG